jgi:hypothetical protein
VKLRARSGRAAQALRKANVAASNTAADAPIVTFCVGFGMRATVLRARVPEYGRNATRLFGISVQSPAHLLRKGYFTERNPAWFSRHI